MLHAKFSASGASRWMACPGSLVLSAGRESPTSAYAAEGTLAHRLYEAGVLGTLDPEDWVGEVYESEGHVLTVDDDMAVAVRSALDATAALTLAADVIQAEQTVNYSAWLELPTEEAFGTADCIARVGDELQIHDYKHGRGVPVSAEDNPQLMLYAGGALSAHPTDAPPIASVRMVIHQPRIREEPSQWVIPVDELRAWLTGRARSAAASVRTAEALHGSTDPAEWERTFLSAGDHCRWCPAKGDCPAPREEVLSTVFDATPASPDEFDALAAPTHPAACSKAWIAAVVSKLDMIEDWVKAVRARALELAELGTLPGYKVVQGRRGARTWTNAKEAEALLRTVFRLKVEDAYHLSVISPTQAERLAKAGTIGPRQWRRAQDLITQPEGKPHLAPADDPRPALRAALTDFDTAPAVDDIC